MGIIFVSIIAEEKQKIKENNKMNKAILAILAFSILVPDTTHGGIFYWWPCLELNWLPGFDPCNHPLCKDPRFECDKDKGRTLDAIDENAFGMMDLNNDGKLSFEEAVAFLKEAAEMEDIDMEALDQHLEHLREFFNELDKNEDGFLEPDELVPDN